MTENPKKQLEQPKTGKDQLEKTKKEFLEQARKQHLDAKAIAAVIKEAMDGPGPK
jgi:tRNA uridine 5-carbamoylmethylation protein Kti12